MVDVEVVVVVDEEEVEVEVEGEVDRVLEIEVHWVAERNSFNSLANDPTGHRSVLAENWLV